MRTLLLGRVGAHLATCLLREALVLFARTAKPVPARVRFALSFPFVGVQVPPVLAGRASREGARAVVAAPALMIVSALAPLRPMTATVREAAMRFARDSDMEFPFDNCLRAARTGPDVL